MLTGKVECLFPGGEAFVRVNSPDSPHNTCLVRHAIPGDTVLLSSIHKRRGMAVASVETIEEPADKRVEASCSVALHCGGCALQFLHTDQHSVVKSRWVKDAFESVITDDTQWSAVQTIDVHDQAWRRRRLRWHVGRNAQQQVILAFRSYQSHALVEIESCMVVTKELEALRKLLQTVWTTDIIALPESVCAVQLSNGIHVVLEYEGICDAKVIPDMGWQGIPLQCWCRDKHGLRPLNTPPVHTLYDTLPIRSEDIQINIGPDDFVQGQSAGNRSMIKQLLAWSEGAKHVVDLFSGVGNLSLPLAASDMQVVGAEVNIASVRAANANAKRLKLPARYQQADLFGQFDVSNFVGADLLIVDPPRKGAKKICNLMNRLLPKKVILVHCDVTSAGRDAQIMQAQGYRLNALRALDLFPFSGHVESMSLWTH